LAQDQPSGETKRGREEQEGKVRLQKGKVERDALAKAIPDLVDIAIVEVVLCAPLLDPLAVELVIVQGEN